MERQTEPPFRMSDPMTTLPNLGNLAAHLANTARDAIPDFTLTSEVPIPIYFVHHGPDPEDYTLLCDFEQFMRENQSGFLARPVLSIWAGRADFERQAFARTLRHAFAAQFDAVRAAMRAEMESQRTSWTLPSVGDIVLWGFAATGSLIGQLVLYIATETGRSALRQIGRIVRTSTLGRAVQGKSAEAELEALIEAKKTTIDAALARIAIRLHPDLYAHAWRGQRPGPMTGIDRDAWPLPDFVQDRLIRS